MEFFAKIVNGLHQLTILAKPYILYIDMVLNGFLVISFKTLFVIIKISHKIETMRIVSKHKFKQYFLSQKFLYKYKKVDFIENLYINQSFSNKRHQPNLSLDVIFIVFVAYSCQKMF